MSDLPTPLITEILSRLPVKSLLRCRCVSKSWKTLIDAPNFINTHLQISQKNTTNHSIIFRSCYLYSAEFPALNHAVVINHPLKCDHYGTEILGSCNGLLCLSNGEEDGLDGTIVYNPATRKHRQLPVSDIEFPDDFLPSVDRLIYGFGYDNAHDDYKLVRVIQFYCGNPDFFDSEVKVYSLKANCWRRIEDFPREYYLSYKKTSGVYVNGCLHWVVSKNPESDGSKYIMAFDLGSEKLKLVPKPKPLCGGCHINVDVLRGCLCVLCNYFPIRSDFWIMEQYGVEGSWTKLFSIEQQGSVLGSFEYVRPIACSKDGSNVLLDKDMNDLFWYNLRTKRAKKANFTGMPKSFDVQLMVESLVPVDGPKKKKRKAKKKRNEQLGQANSQLSTLRLPLLLDIFCRLPAETLLQLTYVCKEWNNLINEPDFAKMHLKGSGKRNDNLYLMLRRERLHLIDFNRLNKAVQIDHPLVRPKKWTDVLGSCNGLLCLYNEKEELAIWNPLTGRCHKIPITEYQSPKGVFQTFVYGFGYDSINDDYKVVQVVGSYSFNKRSHDYFYDEFYDSESGDSDSDSSEVQVYSLKAKCWRSIKSFPLSLCYICPGVLANGALHWVANKNHDTDSIYESILSFDLSLEECRVVPQPKYDDIHFHRSLWVLGGSLCILCHYPRRGVDIWVMKDYEMNNWCKLFSITQPKPIKSFEYIKPLAFSKSGTEVLLDLDYEKLVWYNMKKKTIRHVNIIGLPESFGSEVFTTSLIDPNNLISRQPKLQLDQSSSSFAAFPKKLVSYILRYLPVKNLLQAQCVCKTWYKTINDPEFIKMQLAESSNDNSSSMLILRGEKLFSLDYQLLDKVVEINHPNLFIEESTDIVGSSNGLVCLCKDRDIALLNPWTRKYERLPSSTFRLHASSTSHCWFIYGFGYDASSDDYKVVIILQQHNSLGGGTVHSEIQAYSLKSKCWGKIKQFPYIICHPCSGVLANGALHWVARQNPELYSCSNLLLALDLGSEKWRVVTKPSYIDTDFHMSLGSLKGCLSLLCHYPRQSVDIWVMTEHGTELWTKLITISQPKIIKNFKYLKPLGYSNNGTEVLLNQDNEKLLWFNLVKKTVRYLKIQGLPKSFETVMCSGSLVQIGNPPTILQGLPKSLKRVVCSGSVLQIGNPPTILHQNNEQALRDSQNVNGKMRKNVDGGFLSKGFKLKL